VKSGNVIFNLVPPNPEYENKKIFQYLSEKSTSFLNSESTENEEDPFDRDFANSLSEENILEENHEKLTIGREETQSTGTYLF
jgi:hypothetical protein